MVIQGNDTCREAGIGTINVISCIVFCGSKLYDVLSGPTQGTLRFGPLSGLRKIHCDPRIPLEAIPVQLLQSLVQRRPRPRVLRTLHTSSLCGTRHGAPNVAFWLLLVRPGAPSSDARSPERSVLAPPSPQHFGSPLPIHPLPLAGRRSPDPAVVAHLEAGKGKKVRSLQCLGGFQLPRAAEKDAIGPKEPKPMAIITMHLSGQSLSITPPENC